MKSTIQRNRRPCLTMVLAAILTMITFGCLCGLSLRVIFRPPFLTWQHGSTFVQPVADGLAEQLGADLNVRVLHVKEMADTCAVVEAAVRVGDETAEDRLWVVLYRPADGSMDWVAGHIEAGAVGAVLAWGPVCGEGPGLLSPPDWDALRATTLIAP